MAIIISNEYLRARWANGEKIRARGKSYRVGRMSYGAWFMEPGREHSEREPFNNGTLWPERIPNSDNFKV